MHELLLFAQIPLSRHNQLLRILCGIAGTQPQRVVERHLIFMPRKIHDSRGQQVGGTQTVQNQQAQALQGQLHGELFHLQLVGEIDDGQFADEDGRTLEGEQEEEDEVMKDAAGGKIEILAKPEPSPLKAPSGDSVEKPFYHFEKQRWSLRFHDLPEVPVRRPVTSRMVSSVDIIDGNAIEFMDALGYKYVSEYILEGHRVTHNNLTLLLHHIMLFPPLPPNGTSISSPRKSLPPYCSLVPLDQSGGYVLQASALVQDGTKPESITLGISQLKAFKDMMKGVVELEIGDRLALDTRVK
ncbi:hypothetical protein FGG08_002081 [Glutinoglossum americanum]|uniref:Mediator of RNA polymerase II transcription subunit 18 n=1 Tax=Glutinoglossum americanum TaxID=1670608 RepID=A0A9P8I9Z1_9PEZI|nr:hypothetical protein FGG08_002081 [Glutinoglossum americanum]